jgi:anti-anti-sigma factor
MSEPESQDFSADDLRPAERLTSEVRGHALILTPIDRAVADPTSVEALRREIAREVRRHPSRVYVLNMERPAFISSSFLGMLVTLAKKFRARDVPFRVCNLNPDIVRVLTTSNLTKLIQVEPDVAAAMKE